MRRVRSVIGLIIIKERAAEHGAELSLWKINRVGRRYSDSTLRPCRVDLKSDIKV